MNEVYVYKVNTKYYNDEKELVSCDKIVVFDNMNKVQEFLTDLSENKQCGFIEDYTVEYIKPSKLNDISLEDFKNMDIANFVKLVNYLGRSKI